MRRSGDGGAASALMAALLALCATGCTTPPPSGEMLTVPTTVLQPSGRSEQNAWVYRIQTGDLLQLHCHTPTLAADDEYRLAPDHVISIKFIHSPQLDETQAIRPDGKISLPYIGDVQAATKTVAALTAELQEKFRPFLRSTELYVVLRDHQTAEGALRRELRGSEGRRWETRVRPDGVATFPLIGDMVVAGECLPVINVRLEESYGQKIPGLRCQLILAEHVGSQVFVFGHVKNPGAFPIGAPLPLPSVLALAGGPMAGSDLRRLIVMRKEAEKVTAHAFDVTDWAADHAALMAFSVQPDDIVYVPEGWLNAAAQHMRNIQDLLMFRGWGLNFSWDLHEIDSTD